MIGGQARAFLRYLDALGEYLRHPLDVAQARERLRSQAARRTADFLRILEAGVFGNPGSPYLALFQAAGLSFDEVATLVGQAGLEPALERLYDAGVFVRMDEFKGRKPIVRGGLELDVRPQDFDNPLLSTFYRASTGGSRSPGLSVAIDVELLRHEAAYIAIYNDAFGLTARPESLWLARPPVAAGMKNVLRYAGVGKRVERWWAQTTHTWRDGGWRFATYEWVTRYSCRLRGHPCPASRFTPRERAIDVASQLASWRAAGTPGVVTTNATSAVRVCKAARDAGLDISGSHFRLGGEPLTPGKLSVIAATGATAVTHYAMAEIGAIAMACARPETHDDVHLLTDKLATIRRPHVVGPGGQTVQALVFTTLLTGSPKLMLNVESDDYAVVRRRECGCPFGELGYDVHLSEIRSYEKLTSEGVTFLGTELDRLVEEILPTRFGGDPTDYQLAEEEIDGFPVVRLVISPTVGALDERAVIETVLRSLEEIPGGRVMADQWRQAGLLEVRRREPYLTSSAKILPLHLVREDRQDRAG